MDKRQNKIDRKITMSQAYDMFLKQMGGQTSTGNKDPCNKYCSNMKCQLACGYLRNKSFIKSDW